MNLDLNIYLSDYSLIDCGNQKKIERFGNYTLIRPETSASNHPKLSYDEWKQIADAEFISKNNSVFGEWIYYNKKFFGEWQMCVSTNPNCKANLKLSNTKHIGIFPEQVINWGFLHNQSLNKQTKLLNLFAYTGISSIIAAEKGFKVTHVDSVKKIVEWGKSNKSAATTENIRWLIDDAVKFADKESRRGNKYDGIILDPPSIGKGPKGETWILEKNLDQLLEILIKILNHNCFIIINLYSGGINLKFAHKIILKYFPDFTTHFCDRIYGLSSYGDKIDHGMLIRLIRNS